MTSPPAAHAMSPPRGGLSSTLAHASEHARQALSAWRRAAGGRCVICRGWCEGSLCGCCDARFAFTRARCRGCAAPLVAEPTPEPSPEITLASAPAHATCLRCRLSPPAWSGAIAGVDYGYPWDRLLADFKFHQRLDVVDALMTPLLARLRDAARGERAPAAAPWPPAAMPGGDNDNANAAALPRDLRVVPVPLSRERLRERGYNQSWELARRIARALRLEAHADALFRVRDTSHQLGLHREARGANLQGAFVVSPRHAAWVRGASIALVDDVLTTGATAHAATRTLRAAGARNVRLWVVARTPA